MELNGTAAVVSGGASGLGEAVARDLAAAGARVVVADLNDEQGKAVAEAIGGLFVRTDVSDEQSV
jgi:NAD(P)-dependent dehydrogenase (short-subunit alcohol dehydrogenase family)